MQMRKLKHDKVVQPLFKSLFMRAYGRIWVHLIAALQKLNTFLESSDIAGSSRPYARKRLRIVAIQGLFV